VPILRVAVIDPRGFRSSEEPRPSRSSLCLAASGSGGTYVLAGSVITTEATPSPAGGVARKIAAGRNPRPAHSRCRGDECVLLVDSRVKNRMTLSV